MATTLTFKDLQALTGYQRQSDVERCLRDQRVAFLIGKAGPFTTMKALNQALGVRHDNGKSATRIEF